MLSIVSKCRLFKLMMVAHVTRCYHANITVHFPFPIQEGQQPVVLVELKSCLPPCCHGLQFFRDHVRAGFVTKIFVQAWRLHVRETKTNSWAEPRRLRRASRISGPASSDTARV